MVRRLNVKANEPLSLEDVIKFMLSVKEPWDNGVMIFQCKQANIRWAVVALGFTGPIVSQSLIEQERTENNGFLYPQCLLY